MESYIQKYCDLDTKEESLDQCIGGLLSAFLTQSSAHDEAILEIVRLSEPYLTSTEDKIRTRATALLGKLLSNNDDGICMSLSSGTLHHLIEFFRLRTEDYSSLLPSVIALKTIFSLYSNNVDTSYKDSFETLRFIFDEINVQGVAQSIRQQIYDLVASVLSSQALLLEILEHGDDILAGIIGITEGERDPRCLIKSLHLLSLGMKCFPQAGYECSELVFDNVAGYFPITFRPAPNDPYGITASMLIDALNNVFCSHPAIAMHCIPFLTDKLTAEDVSTDGKLDALECLCRLARSQRGASDSASGGVSVLNGYAVSSSKITAGSSADTPKSSSRKMNNESFVDANSTALTPFLNTLPSLANVLYGFVASGASSGSMSDLSAVDVKSASSERLCMLAALECIASICSLISGANKSSVSKAEASVGYQRFVSPLIRSAIRDSTLKKRSTAATSVTIDSLSCLTALRVVAAIASSSFELFALILLRFSPIYLADIDDQMRRARRWMPCLESSNRESSISPLEEVSPTAIAFIEVLLRSLPRGVDYSENISSHPALLDAFKSIFVRLQRCICLFDANNQLLDETWNGIEDAHLDEWIDHSVDLAAYVSGFPEVSARPSSSDCGSGASSGGGCCGGGGSRSGGYEERSGGGGCCGGGGGHSHDVSHSLKASSAAETGCCGGGGHDHDHSHHSGEESHSYDGSSKSSGCCGGGEGRGAQGCCQEEEGGDKEAIGVKAVDAESAIVDVFVIANDKSNMVIPLIRKSVQCMNVLIKRFFVAVNFASPMVCLALVCADIVINHRIHRPTATLDNKATSERCQSSSSGSGNGNAVLSSHTDLFGHFVSLLCTLYEVREHCDKSVTHALNVQMDSLLSMITAIDESKDRVYSPKDAVYSLLTRLCISEWNHSNNITVSEGDARRPLGPIAIRTVDALILAINSSDNVDIRSASSRSLLELLTGKSVVSQSAFISGFHIETDITKSKASPSRVLFDETDRILDLLSTDVYVDGNDRSAPAAATTYADGSWLAATNRYQVSSASGQAKLDGIASSSVMIASGCPDFAMQLALYIAQSGPSRRSKSPLTLGSTDRNSMESDSVSGLHQLVTCATQRPSESYEISVICELLRVSVLYLSSAMSDETYSAEALCSNLLALIDIDVSAVSFDLSTLARLRLIHSAISGVSVDSEVLQSATMSHALAKLLTVSLALIESCIGVSVTSSGLYVAFPTTITSSSTASPPPSDASGLENHRSKRAKIQAPVLPRCDDFTTRLLAGEVACWIIATLINKLPPASELLHIALHNVMVAVRLGAEAVSMRPKQDGIDALGIAITSDLTLWVIKALLMRFDISIDTALLGSCDVLSYYVTNGKSGEVHRSWQHIYLEWLLQLAAQRDGGDSSGYLKSSGSGEPKRPSVASSMSLHLPRPSNPFSFLSGQAVFGGKPTNSSLASSATISSDIDLDVSYHGGLLNLRFYLGSRCFIIPDANASRCFALTDTRDRPSVDMTSAVKTRTHGTISKSPMWMQKLAHVLLKPLLDAVSGATKATDLAAMWAICGLVSSMPSSVVFIDKDSTPAIVRIVVMALQMGMRLASDHSHSIYHIDDFVVRRLCADALATLHELLMQDKRPVFVGPHLATIVPILIQFSKHAAAPNGCETVAALDRARACHCILRLCTLPYTLLHPYQKTVVKGLKAAIDDPRRFVRRLAVKARNEWSVISDA